MFRRPLRRAVMLGGVAAVAHHAGTVSGERSAEEQAEVQQATPPPESPAAPAQAAADPYAQLSELKSLLDSGALTQAEFDVQKQKILAQ